MKKNITSLITYYLFSVLLLLLSVNEKVSASVDQPRGSLRISQNYDSTITRFSDVNVFLTSVIDFFLQFVGIIAIGAIIYGGFLMLTAGGEEEQHKKGLTVTLYACIGIIMILASYAIVNTVTSFGTGTEGTTAEQLAGGEDSGDPTTPFPNGVIPPAGSLNGGSDDYSKIRSEIKAEPTLGTVPMVVNFDTLGSFDLFSNQLKKSNYFWDFDDDTVVMGILKEDDIGNLSFEYNAEGDVIPIIASEELLDKYEFTDDTDYCDDNTQLNLCLKFEDAFYYKQVAAAQSYYTQIDQELTATLSANPDMQITDIITPAELAGLQKGKQIVDGIVADRKYPVLIYGQVIDIKDGDIPNEYKVLTQGQGPITRALMLLNPGSEGYAATILNPYGVNLGYSHSHKYLKGGNYAPKVMLVNDSGTPFMPEDDMKSWQSIIVRVSRDNIDPNIVPPTAAFTYQFDPDDPARILFQNFSLTDKGANIMDLYEQTDDEGYSVLDRDPEFDSDGDGDTTNDNDFFYFEWDFNIKDDKSGDGDPTNDNEFKDNFISLFEADVTDNGNGDFAIEFSFDDKKTASLYTVEERDAGELNYQTVASDSAAPLNHDITNITSKTIKYYRLKTSDGRKTAELKIKLTPNNGAEISPASGVTYRNVDTVYPEELKSVMVKLMVKNLITQEYDSVVREIKIPSKKDLPKILPTPLFSYQLIPGTTQVKFNNLSLDAEGEKLYRGVSTDHTEVASTNGQYKYHFSWDFDTNSEFDTLLIQPEEDLTKHITPDGTIDPGATLNEYQRDSINDNDINTEYNALGETPPDDTHAMIVTFPEDAKDYSVKLTVYDTTEGGNYTAAELYDERIINLYIPKMPPPMQPIAAFTWESEFQAGTNSVTLNFKNQSLAYDYENEDYYYITSDNLYPDIHSGNYEFIWDFDINLDTNGDGDPANDTDHTNNIVTGEIGTPQDSITIPDFNFLDAASNEVTFFDDYKPHKVKLTVKNIITGATDSTVHTVQKPSPQVINNEIYDPTAAFIWTPWDDNLGSPSNKENFILMISKSRGIDNELITNNNYNDYAFIIDQDINFDEDGDNDPGNDNSVTGLSGATLPNGTFDLYYDNFGEYEAKLTVIHLPTGKQDSVVRKINVTAPGAPIPPGTPMAAFTAQEIGDKQLQFTSVSLNRNGTLIPSTIITTPPGVVNPDPIFIPAESGNYAYTLIWDFDSGIDSNGNNNYKDDNNFSTYIKNSGVFEQGIKNIINPIRYYGNYEDDLAEVENKYGSRLVTLTVIEENSLTGEKHIDTISRTVKLNNPPNIPRPIVKFTYSYTPSNASAPVEVYFNNTSTDIFGYELDPTTSSIEWDFNLNFDSDNDGNTENDIDNFAGNESPCIYTEITQQTSKCIFPQIGDYPIKLTVKNTEQGISDYTTQVIKLRSAPIPPSLPTPSPIAAFTFMQSQDNDKEIIFQNNAMTNEGTPIPAQNIMWDFDTSYDTNGDGNGGNDNDLFLGNDNTSFEVTSIDPITVNYQKFNVYNVRQTVTYNSKVDFVTRKVPVGAIITPLPPLPLFTYAKRGTVVNFTNQSLDSYGEKLKAQDTCSTGQTPTIHNCYLYRWFFEYDNQNPVPNFEGFGASLQYDYEQFGVYNARLEISDPDGNQESMNRTIVIADDSSSQTIKANIVASPKSGTAPLTVTFSSEGSRDELGSITDILWDLDGDGSPDDVSNIDIQGSDYTNVTYTYTKPGHYRVGLAVQGPSGRALAYTWVDVYADPPEVQVLIDNEKTNETKNDPYIALANKPVNFEAIIKDTRATGQTAFSYIWDFDDIKSLEPISTQNIATHTFKSTGQYTVSFRAINLDTLLGTTVERSIKIVPATPEAKIIAKDPKQVFPNSLSHQKFFSGSLDIITNKFDVEFLASDSLGAPMTSSCPNGPGCVRSELEKFEWDFDNGQGTTELSRTTGVIHTFTKPGTYYTKLKVTDDQDVTGEETKIVFIADPRKPVPVIDVYPSKARTGQLVTFNATGSHSKNGPITKFQWRIGNAPFGPGNTGTELSEKISRTGFNTPGIFDIELTITDNQGEITTVLLENVLTIESTPPIARVTSTLDKKNIPNVFLFDAFDSFDNDPGDFITEYTWDFGDNSNIVTTLTPTTTHLFDNIGRYESKLTVKDNFGLTNTAQVVSRVESLLVSKILNIVPQAGKAPLEVNLVGTGGNNKTNGIDNSVIVLYEWDLKDGTIISGTNMDNINHTYLEGGKHEVTLTVYDFENNSATDTKTIYVGNPDPSPLAIIDSGNIETHRTVELTFDGSKSLTSEEIPDYEDGIMDLNYSWDFGDSSPVVTGDWTQTHTYNDLGNFIVTLTVSDDYGRSTQDTITVKVVKAKPQARFTASPSYGESVLLVDFDASSSTDPDNNIDYYLWRFSTNTVITTYEDQISHPFINNSSSPFTYNVILKVYDEDGLADSYSLPITVLPEY
jgi:PKD repeat protein